jgi:hypothetical protein
MPSRTEPVIVEILAGDLGARDLGQVRGDLPGRQARDGQRDHYLIDPGQALLPLGYDLRLEAGIAVPRHADLHWAHVGQHDPGPAAVAEVAATAAPRGSCLL